MTGMSGRGFRVRYEPVTGMSGRGFRVRYEPVTGMSVNALKIIQYKDMIPSLGLLAAPGWVSYPYCMLAPAKQYYYSIFKNFIPPIEQTHEINVE